ncbi:MAG: hypothetical protein ACTSU5_16580 [Promethearchaeota archaeon]
METIPDETDEVEWVPTMWLFVDGVCIELDDRFLRMEEIIYKIRKAIDS